MSECLNAVPNVEIDPEGTFKYVLIKVYAPQTPDGGEPSKVVVRGNIRGDYHGDLALLHNYHHWILEQLHKKYSKPTVQLLYLSFIYSAFNN